MTLLGGEMDTPLTATDFAWSSRVLRLKVAAEAEAVVHIEDSLEALAVPATGQKATSYLYLVYHPQGHGRYYNIILCGLSYTCLCMATCSGSEGPLPSLWRCGVH